MTAALEIIAGVMHEKVGVRIQPDRYPALRAALHRAWPALAHAEIARLALDPATAATMLEALVDEITIKETFFLRDHRQLESIDWRGLQAAAADRGSPAARVWSTACASGEEPYSLALLACEAFASATPPVSILASDVSLAALGSAIGGSYRERAVANVSPDLRERYFTRRRNSYEVAPALRRLVSVTRHNLVADACPPAGEAPFDLILCRNVLIYFDGETCARVVSALEGALAPGGRLVLGAADALCVLERAAAEFRPSASLPRRRPAPARRPQAKTARLLPPAPPAEVEDPMNPELHYLRGIGRLESGDARAAIDSLRRVLYLDSDFELAAFALGRAHEEAGEPGAARRRYQQALRMLRTRPQPVERLQGAIDAAAVIGACEARLTLLEAHSPMLEESA